MKTETRMKIIPEQHKETIVYIAEDGREFYNEYDCVRYEDELQMKRHPVFLSHIGNVEIFGMHNYVELYYFASKEDHDFFIEKMGLRVPKRGMCIEDDFGTISGGAGWYMYWSESDDYYDNYYIRNCESYICEVEEDLNNWKTCINGLMNAKIANKMRV